MSEPEGGRRGSDKEEVEDSSVQCTSLRPHVYSMYLAAGCVGPERRQSAYLPSHRSHIRASSLRCAFQHPKHNMFQVYPIFSVLLAFMDTLQIELLLVLHNKL
jgi:hypothetical protein